MKLSKRIVALAAAMVMSVSTMGLSASAADHSYSRSDTATKYSNDTKGFIADMAQLKMELPFIGKNKYTSSGTSEFVFNKKTTKYTCSIPKNGHTISLSLSTLGSVSFTAGGGATLTSDKKSITYGVDTAECNYVLKGSASRIFSYTQQTGIQYTIMSGKTKKATVIIETEWSW